MQQRVWGLLFASLLLLAQGSSLREKVSVTEFSPKGVEEIHSPVQIEDKNDWSNDEHDLSNDKHQTTIRDTVFSSALKAAIPSEAVGDEEEEFLIINGPRCASPSIDSVDLGAHFENLRLGNVHVDHEPLVTVETVESWDEHSQAAEQLETQNRFLGAESDMPFELIEDAKEFHFKVENTNEPEQPTEAEKFNEAIEQYEAFFAMDKKEQLFKAISLNDTLAFNIPAEMNIFELIFSLARIIRRFLPNRQYPHPRLFKHPEELISLMKLAKIEELTDRLRIAELCLWLGWKYIARNILAAHVSFKSPQKTGLTDIRNPKLAPIELAWTCFVFGHKKVFDLITSENGIQNDVFAPRALFTK